MEVVRYVIVDGAVEEELLEFLLKTNPPHCCLFSPPVQPELVKLAPYLVVVTPEVEKWLHSKETPWGIYLFSTDKIHIMVQHFRRYLWVNIPEQSKPVLFRFYDPRNIWTFMDIITPEQQYEFLLNTEKIITDYQNTVEERTYTPQNNESTKNDTVSYFSFNSHQYNLLSLRAQDNYINKLEKSIIQFLISSTPDIDTKKADTAIIAKNSYLFCKSYEIDDDNSIRIITCLFAKLNIISSHDIPGSWIKKLTDTSTPGYYRAESLILEELGYLP